jgi:(1->4)-alpha-D-glucan 1-alpha-D-glucosylmutase
MSAIHTPRATYRLQFNERFRLRDALALVPYLHELGISHVYASPLLKARPHSSHGYDVSDFSRLNPELGTEEDLESLVAALRSHGMGLVLDIVPNHAGIGGPENRWWWDVLARGQDSPFAAYFDIDWQSPDPRLRGKVLVPVLNAPYHRVIEKGGLQLQFDGQALTLRHAELQFPLAPESLSGLVEEYPPSPWGESRGDGGRDCPISGQLRQEQDAPPAVAAAIAQAVRELNASPDSLDALVQRQHYRLTGWQTADAELNYRRFFNVPTLAGLRVEDAGVFNAIHERVLAWHQRGWVEGWRIDHIDGLRDPEEYLHRLRSTTPRAWTVVEKILEPGERLPASWPVAGTTGYDFLTRATGLFIDPAGEGPLTDFYVQFTGQAADYPALALEKKRLTLRELLEAEVNRLVALALQIAARHWRVRDFPPDQWRAALIELVACLPVYRTYARPGPGQISEADAARISETTAAARRQRSDLDPHLFDFLGDVMLLRLRGDLEAELAMRLQQVTGPAMAKGIEDTALYCFNRLLALNEVGGNPARFGCSVEEFHRACAEAQADWPNSLVATSTHDTKFSEDVRARLALLSEVPEPWSAAVRRWAALNERHRRAGLPDRDIEYRFYQTLVGAWPLEPERALACLDKAACEAKVHTAWTRRNHQYDEALRAFISGALGNPEFTSDVERFVAALAEPGYVNSLAQTLLKLTAPGVPDFYQGSELWDFSLTDPDNRRPVDFERRQRALAELPSLSIGEVWRRRAGGLPKLWLIRRVLKSGAGILPAGSSSYRPLFARGSRSAHVVAFLRGADALTVVPRLLLRLRGDWAGTTLELPAGQWRNELTDEEFAGGHAALSSLLRQFPVAWLTRKEGKQ